VLSLDPCRVASPLARCAWNVLECRESLAERGGSLGNVRLAIMILMLSYTRPVARRLQKYHHDPAITPPQRILEWELVGPLQAWQLTLLYYCK
jgi:hypothetical protein